MLPCQLGWLLPLISVSSCQDQSCASQTATTINHNEHRNRNSTSTHLLNIFPIKGTSHTWNKTGSEPFFFCKHSPQLGLLATAWSGKLYIMQTLQVINDNDDTHLIPHTKSHTHRYHILMVHCKNPPVWLQSHPIWVHPPLSSHLSLVCNYEQLYVLHILAHFPFFLTRKTT